MATYTLLTQNGTVIVDTSAIKSDVEAEYKTVFGLGEDDTIDPSSNEGRLVDAEITSRTSVARNNALLANQQNPNLSYAWALDAHLSLFGSEREAAQQSTCDCLISGVSGTVIAAGSIVKDVNGFSWTLVSEAIIPASGSITKTFRAVDFGPINAAIGEINKIISGVVGWEIITNPTAATVGRNEQSLVSAKVQRKIDLGANSRSVSYSVISAVNKLEGVNGVKFRENSTDSSLVIDGITMPRKSFWLCVDGGAISEIAEAYVTETWGGAFYGFSETVNGSYTDPISGQNYDAIPIDRPTEIPLLIEVTASLISSTDLVSNIKSTVIDWANGDIEAYNGCVLGNNISPFEISAALNQQFGPQQVYISGVRVSKVSDSSLGYVPIPINLWEKGAVTEANITVIQA